MAGSVGLCFRLLVAAVALREVGADPGGNCTLTDRPPRQARYLKFCQDYNTEACCIPGHDLENQVQFENLIEGLGPGCKNPMMYPHIRYFYCLGCDPEQPTHTFGETIHICKSFLDTLWRDPTYEECGVMFSNPCPSNWNDEDFDPYQCGDTLLLPKAHFNDNVTLFINAFKPPGLEDFTFLMIDDMVPAGQPKPPCWSAPAFTNDASRVSGRLLSTLAIMAVGLAGRSLL